MMFFLSRTFNSKNTTTSCLHGAVVVAWVHHKGRQGDLVGNTMKIGILESLKLSCVYMYSNSDSDLDIWKGKVEMPERRRQCCSEKEEGREGKSSPWQLSSWDWEPGNIRKDLVCNCDVEVNTMMQIYYWKPELLQNTEMTFFASNNHCILILQYLLNLIIVSWY